MSPELTNQLVSKYPTQFKNLSYIECGDGWYTLIDRLCYVVQGQIDRNITNNKNMDFFWWSQIKEKFGGLRAYCYGADDYIRGAIDLAENMSYNTCEVSGEAGKLRKKRKADNGESIPAWMKTLSDKEAEKEGYL
jgi:hypothetical protein